MSNAPNFRNLARASLARAKAELASDDRDRMRYAALELRDAMEALTYDRALAWADDLPPEEYKTWQPRKLMAALLAIDPSIGMSATLAVGIETEYGKPAPPEAMRLLGTDQVLTLANLKAHYDALGSYLHMPSLEQVRAGGGPDPTKLRERCTAIVDIVETVLNSPVWNTTLGVFATLDHCMNEDCKMPIRKRLPVGKQSVDVRCFACNAEYTVTSQSADQVIWAPKQIEVRCSTADCLETMALWPHELKSGTHWRCRGCGAHNGLALAVTTVDDQDSGSG